MRQICDPALDAGHLCDSAVVVTAAVGEASSRHDSVKQTSSKDERTGHREKRVETLEPIYDPAFDTGRLCDGGGGDPRGQGNRG